jgi:hypothetical protein
MVQWWLSLNGGDHTVVESGPSVGGGDRRACDAVFCLGDRAAGFLEVEGGRIPETLDKIECFFSSPESDLKTLQFVVFVVYAYIPRAKSFPRLSSDAELHTQVASCSARHPQKRIVLVTIDKRFHEAPRGSIRARNPYSRGTAEAVSAYLYEEGEQTASASCYGDAAPS